MIRELYDHIVADKEVQKLCEFNWQGAVATGVAATALAFGSPGSAEAKPTTSITQAEKRIDMAKLLHAIKHIESSGGTDTRTRYEAGIDRLLRKRFTKVSHNLQNAIKKYGFKALATSYGPYQVLASTAYDNGYTGDLEDLKTEQVSKQVATTYINKLIKSGRTHDVKDVVSAYNAGLGRIGTNQNYINKVLHYYK